MHDFDTKMLVPQYSQLSSRSDVDVSTAITRSGLKLKVPVITSPMNSVTELKMAMAMAEIGGLGVPHRYMTIEDQVAITRNVPGIRAASIGINGDAKERVTRLHDYAAVNIIVFDIAHGDMQGAYDMVSWIQDNYPDVDVMSGNIVTVEAAQRYVDLDVDCFRVGIGAGSSCITRTVGGVGFNQLDAIMNIHKAFPHIPIINDGGIRNSGDLCKVLAAGASASLIGSLFAPTHESCAERVPCDARNCLGEDEHHAFCKGYVRYFGMASKQAEKKRLQRTGESASDIDHFVAPEGKEVLIPYEGKTARNIVDELVGGLKHGMAYCGARTISELQEKAVWTEGF